MSHTRQSTPKGKPQIETTYRITESHTLQYRILYRKVDASYSTGIPPERRLFSPLSGITIDLVFAAVVQFNFQIPHRILYFNDRIRSFHLKIPANTLSRPLFSTAILKLCITCYVLQIFAILKSS